MLFIGDYNFLFDCLTSVIQQSTDSAAGLWPQWCHILFRPWPRAGIKFLDCNCLSCPRFMQHLNGSTPQEFAKKQLIFQIVSYQHLSKLLWSLSELLFGSLKTLSLLTSNTASHLLFAILRYHQSGCSAITSLM